VIWPKQGMTRDGAAYPLATPARRTEEIDSGFWPTPTVHGNHNRKGMSKNSGDGLATAVKTWPTPTASDGTGGPGSSGRQGGENLRTAVGGTLNPTWVEWLMGWPLGWTDLEPLETDKFREWLSRHGKD
jgi:hypothetical protein